MSNVELKSVMRGSVGLQEAEVSSGSGSSGLSSDRTEPEHLPELVKITELSSGSVASVSSAISDGEHLFLSS